MNAYRTTLMNVNNNGEVVVWDIEKIARELPQLFKLSRSRTNGQKTISIRKNGVGGMYNGQRMTWETAFAMSAHNMYAIIKARAAGERATLKVMLPAGELELNEDMTEYVLQSLSALYMKGWLISL